MLYILPFAIDEFLNIQGVLISP